MESVLKSNTFAENGKKMTLKSYYKQLPGPTYPKKQFVHEIALRCGVTLATAKNWILYGFKPANEEHIKVLSELTGINPDDLWND